MQGEEVEKSKVVFGTTLLCGRTVAEFPQTRKGFRKIDFLLPISHVAMKWQRYAVPAHNYAA